MRLILAALLLSAAPVAAKVTMVTCPLDIAATEAAEAIVTSDGQKVTHTSIGIYLESGRTELDLSLIGKDVTLVDIRRITYETPGVENVGAQTLVGGGRLIVEGKAVCAEPFCEVYWGTLDGAAALSLLSEVSAALEKPAGCTPVWPEQ